MFQVYEGTRFNAPHHWGECQIFDYPTESIMVWYGKYQKPVSAVLGKERLTNKRKLKVRVRKTRCCVKFLTHRFNILCFTGELVSKRANDSLDGAPFVVGMVTLLKQFHSDNTDQFFALLSQYVRSFITSAQG